MTPANVWTDDSSKRSIANSPGAFSAPEPIGVLLIGADFQALGIARALAAEQVPVFLLEPEVGIAKYSRCVSRRLPKHDLLSLPDGAGFLLQLAKTESLEGWQIFCVSDDIVEFLAKNHSLLSTTYVLSVPEWQTTRKFYEKDVANEVAQQCAIPIPVVYPSSTLEELLAADIGYPVVLKPTFKKNYYAHTSNKALLARDRESLIRHFESMTRLIPPSQILVQEFLVGGTRNLYSFAAVFDGKRVVSGITAHRLRQHPMEFGHATTYAETRVIPELEELAARLLTAIGYRGVAEVEFMFDERTQTYKFIEMNGRFFGWHTLATNAGLNFPFALYETLRNVHVERTEPRVNAKWFRMLTDAATVAGESVRGRMSPLNFIKVLFSRTPDAAWSWKDPLPFLMEVAISPYLWWKKGF